MAISLQAGPGNNSGSILADGQTVLTFNTTTGVSGVLAPNTVSTASIQNFSVTPDKLSQTIGTSLSSGGFEVLTTNSLDPLGGLEFNTSRKLRLKPVVPSYQVAVRPSDPNSTDNFSVNRALISTSNDPDVLQPYFKTLGGACQYINSNKNNNWTINLDESINEFLFPDTVTFAVPTTALRLSAVESLPTNFINAGLKPGAYIWNRSNLQERSFFNIFASKARLNNVLGAVYFRSRYNIGSGIYTTTRKFNQPPNIASFNLYICNDASLPYGTLGTLTSSWTEIPIDRVPGDARTQYFPFRPLYFLQNNGVAYVNIGFEVNSNSTDTTAIYHTDDRVFIVNTTVKLGGKTRYAWGAILNDRNGSIQIGTNANTALLESPVPGETSLTYPGYGLAVIGTPLSQEPAKLLGAVRLYQGGNLTQINTARDNTGPAGVGAPHTWSIILSGNINFDGQALITQNTVTVGDLMYSPSVVFVARTGTRITGHSVTTSSTSNWFIDYTTPNRAVLPMNFTNYNNYVYTMVNGLSTVTTFNQWTTTLTTNPTPLLTGSRLSFWNINTDFPVASASDYGTMAATADPNVFLFSILPSLRNINSSIITTTLTDTSSAATYENFFVRRPAGLYDPGAYLINGYSLNLY
jgi:hypothetical protein